MPFFNRNRIKDFIIYALCGILAVATTLSNITVLIVLLTNKKLINGQTIYRISLAMSDIFAGIIVFPTFIYTRFNSFTVFLKNGLIYVNINLSHTYVNVVGFFTMLNLLVSIFTLIAAAVDRFKTIYRPLTYNAKSTMTIARKTCIVLWVIGILLAIVPLGLMEKVFRYKVHNDAFVIPILYGKVRSISFFALIILLIPMLMMWIFTVLTFVVYKKHLNKRQKLFKTIKQKEFNKQIRLAFTLGIMVVVFTACLLPSAVIFAMIAMDCRKDRDHDVAVYMIVIATSNSLWNFFIYSARDKAFQNSLKKMCKKMCYFFK